jgi:hypothetical protein
MWSLDHPAPCHIQPNWTLGAIGRSSRWRNSHATSAGDQAQVWSSPVASCQNLRLDTGRLIHCLN